MRQPSEIYESGTMVRKISEKPFKSGFRINTVKSVVEHQQKIDPQTNKGVPAYTFFEDSSIVDAAAVTKVFDNSDTPITAENQLRLDSLVASAKGERINGQGFLLCLAIGKTVN